MVAFLGVRGLVEQLQPKRMATAVVESSDYASEASTDAAALDIGASDPRSSEAYAPGAIPRHPATSAAAPMIASAQGGR